MTAPAITVLMPLYNGEKYITAAIDSVLNQSFQDFELLIINDGSTDNSVEMIHSFQNSKIRLLHNPGNRGVIFTRNYGLSQARGRYIAMLDCDDQAHTQRLELQFEYMEQHHDCVLLGSWAAYMYADGAVFHLSKPPVSEIEARLLFRNCFIQSSVMLRNDQPWQYAPDFPGCEDYDLWTKIAACHPVANLPQVLVSYRVHPESLTHQNPPLLQSYVDQIIQRQLADLKLCADNGEIQLHHALAHHELQTDAAFLEKADQWLCRLLFANRSTGRYQQNEFEKLLAEIWFKVCSQHCVLGAITLRKMVASPLSDLLPLRKRLQLSALSFVYTPPFSWILKPVYKKYRRITN